MSRVILQSLPALVGSAAAILMLLPLTSACAQEWPWAAYGIPPSDLATCIPTERTDWASSYHTAMLQREPREAAQVIFLGDSITMMWRSQSGYEGGTPVWQEYYAPLPAANLGISGDKTEHILWRITGGHDLDGLNPKVLVLLIGINNLLQGSTPEDTAAGITTIVNYLKTKLPQTRILLLGVFPCWEKADDPIRERVRQTNAIIRPLADRERVFYLDIGDKFVEPDGSIKVEKLRDLLHLSEFGYRIWAEAMQPYLADLLDNEGRGDIWGPPQVRLELSPARADDWAFIGGKWALEQGEVRQKASPPGALAFLRQPAIADGRVTAEYRLDPGPLTGGGAAAGIVFRSTDSEHYYYAHFDTFGQIILVYATPGNIWNVVARGKVEHERGQWHRAQVELRGPQITIYLDGKEVLRAEDGTYSAGLVGLRADESAMAFRNIALEGNPVIMQQEWKDTLPPPMHELIVTDGGQGGGEYWPDIIRLQNEDLMVAFYEGYGHGSPPTEQFPNSGRMMYVRSTDGGRTWGEPQVIVDTEDDDHDGSLVQLADGTILCNYFIDIYYKTIDGVKTIQSWWHISTRVVRSTDNGKTWSEPIAVPDIWDHVTATSDPIKEMPDGTLVMPVYGWDKDGPWESGVLFSRDKGLTWDDFVLVDDNQDYKPCEPALCLLPGDRMICVMRPAMSQAYSDDFGKTWTEPTLTGIRGDAPYLLRTSAGLLLCAHRYPGTAVSVSDDDGTTWHGPYQLDTVGGAYPSMVEMPDGGVFCVYYEEGKGTNIRGIHFRPRVDGIELYRPQ